MTKITSLFALAVVVFLSACSSGPDDVGGRAASRDDQQRAPAARSGGNSIWDMLAEERRKKEMQFTQTKEHRERLDEQLERGRAQVPPADRQKMERWWKDFIAMRPEWLESRFQWRKLGPAANEILVENLIFVMVRAFEQNKGVLYQRSRAELYEMSAYSTPYLINALADNQGDDVIRRHCVQLLGLIGRPALAGVVEVFPSSGDEARLDLVRAAAEMGEQGAPQSVSFFRDVVKGEDDFKLRLAAIQGLGRARHADSIPVLIDCLDDNDISIRKFAASSLGGYQDERCIGPLVSCLEKSESRIAPGNREAEVAANCVRSLRFITNQRFKRARDWKSWSNSR